MGAGIHPRQGRGSRRGARAACGRDEKRRPHPDRVTTSRKKRTAGGDRFPTKRQHPPHRLADHHRGHRFRPRGRSRLLRMLPGLPARGLRHRQHLPLPGHHHQPQRPHRHGARRRLARPSPDRFDPPQGRGSRAPQPTRGPGGRHLHPAEPRRRVRRCVLHRRHPIGLPLARRKILGACPHPQLREQHLRHGIGQRLAGDSVRQRGDHHHQGRSQLDPLLAQQHRLLGARANPLLFGRFHRRLPDAGNHLRQCHDLRGRPSLGNGSRQPRRLPFLDGQRHRRNDHRRGRLPDGHQPHHRQRLQLEPHRPIGHRCRIQLPRGLCGRQIRRGRHRHQQDPHLLRRHRVDRSPLARGLRPNSGPRSLWRPVLPRSIGEFLFRLPGRFLVAGDVARRAQAAHHPLARALRRAGLGGRAAHQP